MYVNKVTEETEEVSYQAAHRFVDFQLSEKLTQNLDRLGYKMPSEIQDKSILPGLEGNDVIGIAGTGTGKTAAFLLPIIQGLIEEPQYGKALIITPTRELATQIYEEFFKLTKGLNLRASTLIGGVNMGKSIKDLKRHNDIIIGTPGRLEDMARRGFLNPGQFSILVLDEFDRMLDMGFLKEVERIHDSLTNKEQTFLFSATQDKTQQKAIERMTDSPVLVEAKVSTHSTTAIHQDIAHVPKGVKKLDHVAEMIQAEGDDQRTILFCETKRKVQLVYQKLKEAKVAVETIDGDKTQRARESALRKFKKGQINVLVATDVLSRGIDVKDVELVINYEPPREYSDYIHRIGRTGRAGKKGRAITFVN